MSAPRPAIFSATSGIRRIITNWEWSDAMTSGGVPDGASTPPHEVDSKPGRPESEIVGTSGKAPARFFAAMPIAFTLPPLICGVAATMVAKAMVTSPLMSAVIAAASPLYGTCWMSRPAMLLNISGLALI